MRKYIVILVIALIISSVGASCQKETTTVTVSPPQTTQQSAPTAYVNPAYEQLKTQYPNSMIGYNQNVLIDVEEVARYSVDNSYVVAIAITNCGNSSISASPYYLSLIDSNNYVYQISSDTFDRAKYLRTGTLYSGTNIGGQIVFNLMMNVTPKYLIWDDGSNVIQLDWKPSSSASLY